jgi:hypothetical protein
MAASTTPEPGPDDAGSSSLTDLVARAADLKHELVEFAQSPRFGRRLRARLLDVAEQRGGLDEGTAVAVIDHFALQHRLADGRTVVEEFATRRRPRLSDDERGMVLGWRDVVEGCFEVRSVHGDAVELHNLIDDLGYRVHSNLGAAAFSRLRRGMFVICRVVPVHPVPDAWLVSGHLALFPRSDRRKLARIAAEQVAAHPLLVARNPDLLRRAWAVQAEHRAEFIAEVGADLVVLTPPQAQEALRRHYRRLQEKASGGRAGVEVDELARLPEELMAAESLALVYDEVEGLCFFGNFGRLDALFAAPKPAADRAGLALLRDYLGDDSVPPLAIRRLVQRHPDNADAVFAALLKKPGFSWSRDGEELLRRRKKPSDAGEPMPGVTVVGERLAELARSRG